MSDFDFVEVRTLTQAKYWLGMGEILVAEIEDGNVFLQQQGNTVIFTVQPKLGSGMVLSNKAEAFDEMFQDMKEIEWFVCKGNELIEGKSSIVDKIADFIRRE